MKGIGKTLSRKKERSNYSNPAANNSAINSATVQRAISKMIGCLGMRPGRRQLADFGTINVNKWQF